MCETLCSSHRSHKVKTDYSLGTVFYASWGKPLLLSHSGDQTCPPRACCYREIYHVINCKWPIEKQFHRVVKCDVTKIKICEPMGFVEIIREIKTKNVSLPRISMLVQIVGEILPQLCSNNSIQILLKMAWFLTLGTKPFLEGFVWGHQGITMAISHH